MKNRIVTTFILLIGLSINAQSYVNTRESYKKMSYPIERIEEYYSDIMDFLMFDEKSNKKYGFILSDGKIFKEAEFNYASDFVGKHANIVKDKIPGLLFKNGEAKYFPDYDLTHWTNNDLGLAIKENKYGFINTEGKVIVPLIYDDAFPFYDGFASVKRGDKWFYIDDKGKEVSSLKNKKTSYKPIINSMALVSDTSKVKTNKDILTFFAIGMTEFLTKVKKSEYPEDLYDLKRNKVLNFSKYDDISGYFYNGFMIATKNGKVGVVDKHTNIIIPFEYDEIKDVSENKIIAKKSGFFGVLNLQNKILIPFKYKIIHSFSEGLALVSEDTKKIGYIDENNYFKIQPYFDFCWFGNFKEGLAVVKKENMFGYINKNGEQAIPLRYKEVYPFLKGIALVRSMETDKYFYINKKGEKVLNCEYTELYPVRNGFSRFIK